MASCFSNLIAQVVIHIKEDELIAGEGRTPARTAPLCPEFCTWMTQEFMQGLIECSFIRMDHLWRNPANGSSKSC